MADDLADLEQDVLSLQNELESLRLKSTNLKDRISELKKFDPYKRSVRKKKARIQKQKTTRRAENDDNRNKINKTSNVLATESITNATKVNNPMINNVMKEFGFIFEKYPQLHDILFKDYRLKDGNFDTEHDNNGHIGSDVEANFLSFSESEPNSFKATSSAMVNNRNFMTPNKKQKKNTNDSQLNEDDNLPEHEWVLKNQPIIEHKMFDTSVGDLLDTTILSSPSKRKNRPQMGIDSEQYTKSNHLKNQILLENMFRLFGVTFFPVIDPTDLQLNVETQELDITREMLGIRFDIFNQMDKQFETPFYILLKRKLKSQSWSIFKHTIPNYIDIELLFVNITINGTSKNGFEDIYIFAKEIYLQLWKNSIRSQIFNDLLQEGIISIIYNDMRSTRVQFEISDTPIKLELQIKEDQIKSVRVLEGLDNDTELQSTISIVLIGSIYDLKYKLNMIRSSNN
ncbi:Mcm21p PWA37_005152 [Arxiozyma heterogenica]|uniref:Uncharacterized protein n=1 Tax=Arxiozyma heterogenica TaxID=278026 RepID=A0AAN7WNK3_9SACH|nr:hypothetical protein RI543_000093 [Kazachstania heterogenica]